jgi:hypothetical protein
MYDPNPHRGPETRGERWTVGLISLAIGGAFAVELFGNDSPAAISVVLILGFWIPLLVLHEVGHAIAARLLGWQVETLSIGFGRKLTSFRRFGIEIEIRALPVEGFVRCRPTTLRNVRARSAVIYAAGPGIELLFAAGIWLAAGPALFTASMELEIIALQSLALAAAMGAVLNLIPHSSFGPDGEIANDGLGVIWSFALPIEHFERTLVDERER